MKLLKGLAVTATIIGLAGVQAEAQDFFWNSAGARSMGLGGAYVPSSAGALEALTTNPAGLSVLSSRTVDLSLTGEFARGSFTNSVNQNSPMTTSPGVMPYGAFGMPIGHSRFSFGLGVTPELMSISDWRYVDAPGAAGATYGLQEQKAAILAARSAAGFGVSFGPKLALGATFGVDYNQNTLEAPYIFQQQPVLAGLKTMLDLHTDGFGWNTSVGAIVRPSRKVTLGLSWKSRTVINSTGTASGNAGAQFAALGLAGVPAGFNYSAAVRNVLLALQANWVNWHDAFVTLPVALTNGTNAAINGLLNSSSLNDGVPLNWKDQFSFHGGVERLLTENVSVRGGFAHMNNPVPGSTLSPLTAAIMANQLTTGVGYRTGRYRFDLGYAYNLTGQGNVQQSSLLAGEYNNSIVRLGTQALTLSTSIQF
jgi:long-subunit fatty acid transport protein